MYACLFLFFYFVITQNSFSQDEFGKKANYVKELLAQRQNKKGTWNTYVNFDTVPENLRKDNNFFVGMLIADLLQSYSEDQKIDSLINNTLNLSFCNINPENGFLKYYNRYEDMPEDTDDTGLFWYLATSVDSGFVRLVIDSLQKYKTENGLYYEWLRKGGISHMPQTGTNPETVEIIPNIHVFLFLSKYDTCLSKELCKALQAEDVVSDPEYWVYYYRTPWLFYIRQADMINNNCILKGNLPSEIKGPVSQKYYEKMSKLIRDISLGDTASKTRKEAVDVLNVLSIKRFEYIENNPMLIYHSDLTSRGPAHFWSYDLPYALWLRLYHEYDKNIDKSLQTKN